MIVGLSDLAHYLPTSSRARLAHLETFAADVRGELSDTVAFGHDDHSRG